MHVLVAIGYDIPRPHNAKLMQQVLEDKQGVTIKVGLVTDIFLLCFGNGQAIAYTAKEKENEFFPFLYFPVAYTSYLAQKNEIQTFVYLFEKKARAGI